MSADESSAAALPSKPRRFPVYFCSAFGLLWLATLALPVTRDYKVVAGQVALAAVSLRVVVWWIRAFFRSARARWLASLGVAAMVLAFVLLVRLQTDGDGRVVGWTWRAAPLPDQTLAAPVVTKPAAPENPPEPITAVDEPSYPAFLGGGLWAEAAGVSLDDDWQAHPPEELWRQPIGAGWSAFAVAEGLAVTQEQRGDYELVVAYRIDDGSAAWFHNDRVRFDPIGPTQRMGGVGPRATPTIFDGRVLTHGATGLVNCLDLRTGRVVWTCDTHERFGAANLMWGKSGSPLVLADQRLVVIGVGAAGSDPDDTAEGASLVAFDVDTGEVRWAGGGRVAAYATPSMGQFAGRRQILQVNQHFLTAHDAETGAVLWEFPWPGSSSTNASCSQAIPLSEDRVFLSKGYGVGSVLLEVRQGDDGAFAAEPVWRKPVMKTKFGNVVLRDGHVYGLDGIVLQCVELATGRSVWKKRRRPSFGHGQLMLAGSHLLIVTEGGEVVLADASPGGYRERARLQALDADALTWNNPALAGPYLLVRNATEAVCYRLPLKADL